MVDQGQDCSPLADPWVTSWAVLGALPSFCEESEGLGSPLSTVQQGTRRDWAGVRSPAYPGFCFLQQLFNKFTPLKCI